MAKTNIFTLAKKLRDQYPRKFKQWQEYVQLAKDKIKKEICTDTTGPVTSFSGIMKKKKSTRKKMGSVSALKKRAYDMVKEELAWLLFSRDQAKTKTERNKLTKKVRLKRIELNKLK